MSKLIVEVCKISDIQKHPNADRLRIAEVKGWQCIIGLEDFSVNDLIVFFPPDCILPEELIDKYNLEFVKKGGRLRTVKLRGIISQGLCLPVPKEKNWKEGKDVSKELGIIKYEPPKAHYQGKPKETLKSVFLKYKEGKINLRRYLAKSIGIIKDVFRKKKNINPLFNKYTDIENVKNYNKVFKDGDEVVITEKIHGTNFRAGCLKRPTKYFWQRWRLKFLGEYEFVYGSHNVQLSFGRKKNWYGEDIYGLIAKKYSLGDPTSLQYIPEDYIIYGEIYGKKIQELEYEIDDKDVAFFDVKYKGEYLDYRDFEKFCAERCLPTVPLLNIETFGEDTLPTHTGGTSILAKCKNKNTKHIREGCVVKPLKEEFNRRIGRKILKSINPEYLLTKDRTEHH